MISALPSGRAGGSRYCPYATLSGPAGRIMMQMLGSFAEFGRDMGARANPRQAQGGSRTGPKGQSASKPMAHQRTEILAMLAAGRAGADIARIFRCIAPRLAASQPRREPLPVRRADEPVFITRRNWPLRRRIAMKKLTLS
jgi:DNA invertase Pin-like site-specific DNA recombinase